MKIDIANPATRFLALSAIALTLASSPSRADWTTVRADGSIVTVSSNAKASDSQADTTRDDYAEDTFDGPQSAPAARPARRTSNRERNRERRNARGTGVSSLQVSPGQIVGLGGGRLSRRGGSSIGVYPGYAQPGYGYAAPDCGVGAPGYGYPSGTVTVITSPVYVGPYSQFPGFAPIPGTPVHGGGYYYPPPTVVQTYPAPGGYYPPPAAPYGYPAYPYGYPNGTTTHSYGGINIGRGGVSVSVGGSRTTTQSTWGTGLYR